ncbi:energy-coupling factor ABC transporter ATP-binding protein [Oscillatoria sp. FACHB-1406]|uniref:ABC transporter ATP-binding protein n=1 Tax=Oscillatoria sp. FACHB-1406 TaxID=2692846 RepID=UPI001688DD4C|nr:energy-coupling factor ABC transporter ATP-binding protein [Oscillatoria sp. FACHB-1406]MBD2577063.1 energy-coupling factor ABC transporter ATP-binding protein [Oscillatoria sp. FACHB-1406]
MLYLKNLVYHPPATPTPILKSLNLELPPQQLGLVVGPSGSGKSTLLEILSGLAEPTGGSIYWGSSELTFLELQMLGGLVFQFPERHFCGGTLLEELRLGHPEIGSEQLKTALKEVGLDHLPFSTAPTTLSGGQQRRLALAVQLVRQPNLLMLDEPTAGLDWSMRRQLVKLLAKLKEHWTLLVVTHEAGELVEIADRCWQLTHGVLTAVEPRDLAARTGVPLSARALG